MLRHDLLGSHCDGSSGGRIGRRRARRRRTFLVVRGARDVANIPLTQGRGLHSVPAKRMDGMRTCKPPLGIQIISILSLPVPSPTHALNFTHTHTHTHNYTHTQTQRECETHLSAYRAHLLAITSSKHPPGGHQTQRVSMTQHVTQSRAATTVKKQITGTPGVTGCVREIVASCGRARQH